MLTDLDTLFDANASQAKGIAAIYQMLIGGVPSIGGFTFLINGNNATNFGAGVGPVFNDENIYINVANALVQGNSTAKAIFDTLAVGPTLKDQVISLYKAIIPLDKQVQEGLDFITRPAGLDFYQQVALERGITTANGGAIIALASILKIAVDNDIGVGNSVNDLIKAVKDGSAVLPDTSDVVIPIETADGSAYDDAGDAAGVTTVFSGSGLDNITDGTLELTNNIYTDQSPASDVQSILVANGADLVAKGVIALGGAVSELTVIGAGSTLMVEAGVGDSENSNFGRFAGETSTINIFSGGAVTFDKKINLAELRVESDRGTLGGTVTADLNVLGGGMLFAKTEANFAANWKDDNSIGNGSEKAIANVLVNGQGSSIDIQHNTAHFGSSAGTASLTISGGGTVTANEVRFGFVTNLDLTNGGEGNLSIMGQGSSLTLSGNFSEFGVGVGSVSNIVIDDQGKFTAKEVTAFRAGGSGTLTVSNGGMLDLAQLDLGQVSGSTADVFVTSGGKISVERHVNLAEFVNGQTFSDGGKLAGVANGASVVNLEISGGGIFVAGENFSAAARFSLSPDFAPGNETGLVNITVTGAGSLMESKSKYSDFGVSKGGVANVNILDGGKAIFGDGANFGVAFDDIVVKGGEGHLTVSGAGSSVSFQAGGKGGDMGVGDGANTSGSITVAAGGVLMSGGIKAGRNGGTAAVNIDGGSVSIGQIYDDGNSAGLDMGRDASPAGKSTVSITNGGTLVIDGQGGRSPYINLGRNAGGEASLELKGTGSSITLKNDTPVDFANGVTDFGNAVISIGRDGTGSMSITEGAQVHNTQHGAVIVGDNAGSVGTLLVDGAGSVLDYGGIMWIGTGSDGGGTATFSVLHGASVNSTGMISSENPGHGIQLGSTTTTMTVDNASSIKSDIFLRDGNFVVGPAVETVSIQGDFDQTGGKISLEIDGATSSDKLITSGVMKLDAKIDIDFINSFAGAVGNSFELFNASSFVIGSNFALDVEGLGDGLDAQLQVNGGVASLVIFDSSVPDVLVA